MSRVPSSTWTSPALDRTGRGSRHPVGDPAKLVPIAQRPSAACDGLWRGSRHTADPPRAAYRAQWLSSPIAVPPRAVEERDAAVHGVGRRAGWLASRVRTPAGRVPSVQPRPRCGKARRGSHHSGNQPRITRAAPREHGTERAAAVSCVGRPSTRFATPWPHPRLPGAKRAGEVPDVE